MGEAGERRDNRRPAFLAGQGEVPTSAQNSLAGSKPDCTKRRLVCSVGTSRLKSTVRFTSVSASLGKCYNRTL